MRQDWQSIAQRPKSSTVGWDVIPASICEHARIASQPSSFNDTQHSMAIGMI